MVSHREWLSLFDREAQHGEQWKGYERMVGFDTMPDAEDTWSGQASYTLQVKSKAYARTKHTRSFMCAVDVTQSRFLRELTAVSALLSG